MKNSSFETIAIAFVITMIFAGVILENSNREELEDQRVKAENSFPPPPENARSMNFKTQ